MPGDLEQELQEIIHKFSGIMAVSAQSLNGVHQIDIDADLVFPMASVIKVPIMMTLFELAAAGQVSLSTRLSLQDSDKRGGSGILKAFESGLEPTVRDVATLMVILSDNTATNMALDVIGGGVETVNASMDGLGLATIRLHNRIDFEAIGDDIRRLGVASPRHLRTLMEMIALRSVVSPELCEEMEAILEQQQYLNQFPRYMRVTPYWRELGQVPEIVVANKTGFYMGTRVDAGIVRFPGHGGFTYCLANHEGSDLSFLPESEGDVVNGLAGRAILRAWWPESLGECPVVDPASRA